MTLCLVAGARPQFVKAAALLPALRARTDTLFVHSGQHRDAAMVEAHFAGLGLAAPDVRLDAPPGEERLAAMTDALAATFRERGVTRCVVVGDTDTTLAGARAARDAGIPVAHVEAGARSGEPALPEEKIRIEVDAIADLLFCSTRAQARHLKGRDGVHVTGDVMADVLLAREAEIRARAPEGGEPYAVLTMHRAATANDAGRVAAVLGGVGAIGMPVDFPAHPRLTLPETPPSVRVLEPLPYLDFLGRVAGAAMVLTDSGGLQKEAYLLGVPCLTLRGATEWGETMVAGWNVLVGTDPYRIRKHAKKPPRGKERPPVYGDGRAAERIAEVLA